MMKYSKGVETTTFQILYLKESLPRQNWRASNVENSRLRTSPSACISPRDWPELRNLCRISAIKEGQIQITSRC